MPPGGYVISEVTPGVSVVSTVPSSSDYPHFGVNAEVTPVFFSLVNW